jgi:hypothetical protein
MVSFFQNIVGFLNKEGIPYMLSGSLAMSYYVPGRSTKDFDFIVHIQKERATKIVAHFTPGYYCDQEAIQDAVQRKSMFNVIEHATNFKADFFILNDEPYEREKFSRRVRVKYFDSETFIIAAEDLLLSKLIWIQQLQSGRQMEDISMIAVYPSLDWGYIHRWISELNLSTFDLALPK